MWRYATARSAGTSHKRVGAPCQDRFACVQSERGITIAVSDGAGSAARCEQGAELAVSAVVEFLRPYIDAEIEGDWSLRVKAAALSARQAILEGARKESAEIRDYACTLLIVVLTPMGGAALQIGDGVIVYRDHDGWAPLIWPQKGEYANTTHFLTEDAVEDLIEIVSLPSHQLDLAVMTDGLENLVLHFATRSVYEPFLEALFGPLRAAAGHGEAVKVSEALTQLLTSPRVAERTDDDLTMVMVTPA